MKRQQILKFWTCSKQLQIPEHLLMSKIASNIKV